MDWAATDTRAATTHTVASEATTADTATTTMVTTTDITTRAQVTTRGWATTPTATWADRPRTPTEVWATLQEDTISSSGEVVVEEEVQLRRERESLMHPYFVKKHPP